VRDGLAQLERALGEQRFDPLTSERRFVLAASDFVQLVVLPKVLDAITKSAPNVRVEVRSWGRHSVPTQLVDGEFDVVLGYFDQIPAGHEQQALFEEPYACIVREGHPAVGKRLTAKVWASIPHVVVSEAVRSGPTGVDRALRAVGLQRKVALTVPHFLVVPSIVATSDLSAAIDRQVALAFPLPLRVFPPPLPLPVGRVSMVWHERTSADPALRWLRGLLASATPAR